MRLTRRDFVGTGAAALAQIASPILWARNDSRPQGSAPVIDGLGEIRPEYGPALLDEVRASGLRGCVVTVGNPALHSAAAYGDMVKEIREYEAFVAREAERLALARSVADLDRAVAAGRIGLLLYTQNATPIEDDAGRLEPLRDLGVRIVQLTYNTRNLLGDGCLERTNAGLSRFGLEVVERMNALGLLVDVSHSGDATTQDAIRHSSAPVAVTHAGCRAVFDHPRNKSDEALRALAERGGVIGIYQINPYLGPKERNSLDDYLAHLEHAIRRAGVEHVGIGSDREYQRIPDTEEERRRLEAELSRLRPGGRASFRWPFFVAELNHPRRMETIAEALRRRGRPAREVDLILGGNFHRLFRETIG
ncbi:MAG TPA: membrane dipeptidase [Gemmatimonadales bacterium]